MDGIIIVQTSTQRPILASPAQSPILTTLAIQAALATSDPIVWISSVKTFQESDGSSSESSSESDDDVYRDGPHRKTAKEKLYQPEVWAENENKTVSGGQAVVQIERDGIRFIAPVVGDMDPLVPLTFLTQLYGIIEQYVGGPVNEASLKDHFPSLLAVFSEALSANSGMPMTTSFSQLKELIPAGGEGLLSFNNFSGAVNAVASAASNSAAIPAISSPANLLLTSPIPWRRQGVKYASNEIYFDQIETLNAILSVNSSSRPNLIACSVSGTTTVQCKLSGMPDMNVNFFDPSIIEDVGFHDCVRVSRWKREKVVSFMPPDSNFTLLNYTHRSPQPLLLLPLTLIPTISSGLMGVSFTIELTANSISSLKQIQVRLPLTEGANTISVSLITGTSNWQINEGDLVWDVELGLAGRAKLEGTWLHPPELTTRPKPRVLTVTFNSPDASFSPVRIKSAKLAPNSEQYTLYKGVRSRGTGLLEYRL